MYSAQIMCPLVSKIHYRYVYSSYQLDSGRCYPAILLSKNLD
jgi:hypothetical protein